MKEMDKTFANALSDVLGFDVTNQEECIENSSCGVGTLFDTKEKATECCLKVNALGDFFGWEKYKVYEYNGSKTYYTCMTETEYKEYRSTAHYKPL